MWGLPEIHLALFVGFILFGTGFELVLAGLDKNDEVKV